MRYGCFFQITTDFNATSNYCECYALRDFKKGEQIFISYGPRTNSDFFVHSGFVYMENKQVYFLKLFFLNYFIIFALIADN